MDLELRATPMSFGTSRGAAAPAGRRPPATERGHWEGEIVGGAGGRPAVAVLVERASRCLMFARVEGAGAQDRAQGILRRMHEVPPSMRRTLCLPASCGSALQQALARGLRMQVRLSGATPTPTSFPRQAPAAADREGGLAAQVLPPGLDLPACTDRALRSLEQAFNATPCAALDGCTPAEAYADCTRGEPAGEPAPPAGDEAWDDTLVLTRAAAEAL